MLSPFFPSQSLLSSGQHAGQLHLQVPDTGTPVSG